jgi:hypothetical protein
MIISFLSVNLVRKKDKNRKNPRESKKVSNIKVYTDLDGNGESIKEKYCDDELLWGRGSEAGGSVRNRANKLKDFENAKFFKTISDYKKKQSDENLTSTTTAMTKTNKPKKKLRFLMDPIEESRL